MHIVLAGGGTAGHVNPLLAVADAIRRIRPEASISIIGTAVGLEHDLVPRAGYELDTIEKVPFPRRPNKAALQFPAKWMRETRKVRDILRSRHADVVVGFGGYASAPVYSAAHRMGIPVVIHEQNARAGMANKLGARYAAFIGTAYENTGLKPGSGCRMERVGLPLRPAISTLAAQFASDRASVRQSGAEAMGIDPARPMVLVTGGSLGAVSLNRAVASSAAVLLEHAQVVHLTGKGKIDEVRSLVGERANAGVFTGVGPDSYGKGDYHAAEYLERIDLAFACADLVICRSGAGSVSELGPACGVCPVADRQRGAAVQRASRGQGRRRADGGRQGFHRAVGAVPCAVAARRTGPAARAGRQGMGVRHSRRRRHHGPSRA